MTRCLRRRNAFVWSDLSILFEALCCFQPAFDVLVAWECFQNPYASSALDMSPRGRMRTQAGSIFIIFLTIRPCLPAGD